MKGHPRAWDWFVAYCVPRWLWVFTRNLRHPRSWWCRRQHWKRRPAVGDYCTYHYEGPYRVLRADGDDLTLETPNGPLEASWMHCCDPAPTP